ncbi:MAG: cupredoxin domain-containing protein [Rubrivivax sp.]|nr:cupredoxin domain-containing protein [Rubrivivax sp.]
MPRRLRRRHFVQALATGLACTRAPGARAAGSVVVVEIRDYKYIPQNLTVKAGTTVRWVNAEKRTTHTVRFDGPDGMESERLFPGDTFERRFDKPARYAYICGPHPEMKGLIEVID